MTTWFTSDLHFGHERIIEFCNRPFDDVTHMNIELVHRWNSVVEPEDQVFVLGDLALGKLDESLQWASMLLGNKFLVPGNHDRMWSGHSKVRSRDRTRYEDAGFTILDEQFQLKTEVMDPETVTKVWDQSLLLCHFPYVGDSQETDRHVGHRPQDEGLWLLHGHTHWSMAINGVHPRQIHVGVDAWNFEPVPLETVQGIIFMDNWISETLDEAPG